MPTDLSGAARTPISRGHADDVLIARGQVLLIQSLTMRVARAAEHVRRLVSRLAA